ncbi:MAG: adenylyl-sulfate kinase [Acidovorax sp.]|nr:adenylyl-sulfate kinase [Acidovorax sp.]
MKPETATTWWLTGLPGAGKTTLAQALAAALRDTSQTELQVAVQQLLRA